MNITQEQFHAYTEVQYSGITNMWDIEFVCKLANNIINEEHCFYIMKHYSELKEKYGVGVVR